MLDAAQGGSVNHRSSNEDDDVRGGGHGGRKRKNGAAHGQDGDFLTRASESSPDSSGDSDGSESGRGADDQHPAGSGTGVGAAVARKLATERSTVLVSCCGIGYTNVFRKVT